MNIPMILGNSRLLISKLKSSNTTMNKKGKIEINTEYVQSKGKKLNPSVQSSYISPLVSQIFTSAKISIN